VGLIHCYIGICNARSIDSVAMGKYMKKACFVLTLLLNALSGFGGRNQPIGSYVVYYGDSAKAGEFRRFDLVVLESTNYNIVGELKKEGKQVLAYLSIGEVNSTRHYFSWLKEHKLLLDANPNWPEAFLIDIRKPEWRTYIIETLVPEMLDSGFDGIFIDTLDSSLEKERIAPRHFNGMKSGAVEIIRAIRKEFPKLKIMLNRAYPVAAEVGDAIDYVMGESIYSTYDFKNRKYIAVPRNEYIEQVKLLKVLKKEYHNLQIMTLDYCGENEVAKRLEIYREQRQNGFIPYVSVIGLDRVVALPER